MPSGSPYVYVPDHIVSSCASCTHHSHGNTADIIFRTCTRGEVESPEHFLFDCPVYQAQRQKLWEKLTSDPDVAAKCQILDGKSDEEKLHSMLNEEFWGVDVDEESGLVYGPFKHAFKCIAKYVAAAWKIRNAYAHPSDVA